MLASPSITEFDLMAGRWDYAYIRIMLVNWRNLAAGAVIQRVGRLGEVSAMGITFKAEIRGLMQALSQPIGQVYQPSCRADFGDDKCKFDISTVTIDATLSSVSADGLTLYSPDLLEAAGAYDGGKVLFMTGANHGLPAEVKTSAIGSINLQMPMPFEPLPGDIFKATQGCLKRLIEDCRDRYDNVVNFRGEPYLPGANRVVQYAQIR